MSQIAGTSKLIELRYSLNGITDIQISALFGQIEQEENQIIIKRISDSRYALSADDIIIEGEVSPKLLNILAQVKLEALSCKISTGNLVIDNLRNYSAFSWINRQTILSGICIIPINQMQQLVQFSNPTQFMNLITSTAAGSYLRSLLAVKPRGIIAIENNVLNIIFPAHRIDFLLEWVRKLETEHISIDWLSGSTGELHPDLVKSIGSIDQSRIDMLVEWLEKAKMVAPTDLNIMYRRALASLM